MNPKSHRPKKTFVCAVCCLKLPSWIPNDSLVCSDMKEIQQVWNQPVTVHDSHTQSRSWWPAGTQGHYGPHEVTVNVTTWVGWSECPHAHTHSPETTVWDDKEAKRDSKYHWLKRRCAGDLVSRGGRNQWQLGKESLACWVSIQYPHIGFSLVLQFGKKRKKNKNNFFKFCE